MKVALGGIFEISSGGTPSKTHAEYYDGNIPWVKTGDLKSEYLNSVDEYITDEGLKNSSAKMYEPGTVLLAMYGATIGAASILTFNACTNQACAAFKPCKYVIPEYLYYFLLSRREKFIHDGVGGAQPNISGRYLKQVEFELYPINEQRFVISVLDRVNRIISLKKEEIKKLDELIKARFVEMFGALNNTSYETLPLGDICEFIKDGTHQTPTYTEDKDQGYKFLSSKDVTSQEISWSNIKYIPESLHNELYSKLAPRRGDILLAKNGTTGVAAVVDTDEVFDIYVSLALLRPKVGYNSRYLWAVINSNDTKMQFNANLKGIGVPNLHLGEIKKAKVIVPPLEQQEKFAVFLEQIDKSKVVVPSKIKNAIFVIMLSVSFGQITSI